MLGFITIVLLLAASALFWLVLKSIKKEKYGNVVFTLFKK